MQHAKRVHVHIVYNYVSRSKVVSATVSRSLSNGEVTWNHFEKWNCSKIRVYT